MKAPNPGLRPIGGNVRLHYDAQRPSKAQINVPPGAVIDVPDVVAAQLQASDSHFKPVDTAPADDEPDETPDDDVTCAECGFVAKTPGGLSAHQRKHED